MASYPLIFPSLSRQPSMDTTKSTENDTISDSMEIGYVATRPRFTRARDTFKVNVRNLVEEDKRALDAFLKVKAQRGANSFLYPNLLPNGSFEFPALSADELVWGWSTAGTIDPSLNISVASFAPGVEAPPTVGPDDSSSAILFSSVAGKTLAASENFTSYIQQNQPVSVTPGEVYLFHCRYAYWLTGSPAGITFSPEFFFNCDYALGVEEVGTGAPLTASATWADYWALITIPSGSTNIPPTPATDFRACIGVNISNPSSSAPVTLTGQFNFIVDEVGCGLFTPVQLYGRTVGSDALPRPVRFSSLPEFSDIGFGGGVKRYGVHFELTEV
jgi:hypothetical protein